MLLSLKHKDANKSAALNSERLAPLVMSDHDVMHYERKPGLHNLFAGAIASVTAIAVMAFWSIFALMGGPAGEIDNAPIRSFMSFIAISPFLFGLGTVYFTMWLYFLSNKESVWKEIAGISIFPGVLLFILIATSERDSFSDFYDYLIAASGCITIVGITSAIALYVGMQVHWRRQQLISTHR